MIQVKACGVCHSDLSILNGTIPTVLPHVMGHEAAGIVTKLGEGVTAFEIGDHVVSHLAPSCGHCPQCLANRRVLCEPGQYVRTGKQKDGTSRLARDNGEELTATMSLGVLADYAVMSEQAVVKIPKDVAFEKACLLGCGVITGVGAVLNTARIRPGCTVAVYGCGGIGLSVIQGAKLAGASRIVAVDISDNKLEMARELGATHTVNSSVYEDPSEPIREITQGGADYAFEAVGANALLQLAVASVCPGGDVIAIGVSGPTVTMEGIVSDHIVYQGKSIKGSRYGNANPSRDFPAILDHCNHGRFNIDSMVTKTYNLEDLGDAFTDMESHKNARGVVVL